jgi:hypothetical protein
MAVNVKEYSYLPHDATSLNTYITWYPIPEDHNFTTPPTLDSKFYVNDRNIRGVTYWW